jgi:endonuclease YncB( thermonuclease family)
MYRYILAMFAAALAAAQPAWAADEGEDDSRWQRAAVDAPLPGPVPARVLRVIDGDTVRVRAHIWLGQEVETNVRLKGVDTAEKRAHCDYEREMSERATRFVEAKLANESISLADVTYDKYGRRVVARIVTARGEDLSQTLLDAGLAKRYDGGRKERWCASTEVSEE